MLDDGGTAPRVARVAVDEAARRGVPVRFLEVMRGQADDEGCALTEEILFRAGLRALRGHPRTHSVFEVVRGHVGSVVRQRSHGALLLVVGEAPEGGRALVARCLTTAECPVLTIPVGDERLVGPPSTGGHGTFGPREQASTA